eukprot:15464780-Alexandrium_andersonii.AAC.1
MQTTLNAVSDRLSNLDGSQRLCAVLRRIRLRRVWPKPEKHPQLHKQRLTPPRPGWLCFNLFTRKMKHL